MKPLLRAHGRTTSAPAASTASTAPAARGDRSAGVAPSVGTAPSAGGTRAPGPQDGAVVLRDPSVVELVWMEELRQHLRAPGSDLRSVAYLSSLFDAYCRAWHRAPAAERWDPDYLVGALGVCLGDALVRQCSSSRWQVVDDEPRTTVAVRNDLFRRTFFPVDAVARRWITAELGWMPTFVTSTGAQLQRGALRTLAAEDR